jgi:hypothetical protein
MSREMSMVIEGKEENKMLFALASHCPVQGTKTVTFSKFRYCPFCSIKENFVSPFTTATLKTVFSVMDIKCQLQY